MNKRPVRGYALSLNTYGIVPGKLYPAYYTDSYLGVISPASVLSHSRTEAKKEPVITATGIKVDSGLFFYFHKTAPLMPTKEFK